MCFSSESYLLFLKSCNFCVYLAVCMLDVVVY